ncbi:MAG: nitrous oxide reductase family maturation protein NosD [Gilvibacter sp.]
MLVANGLSAQVTDLQTNQKFESLLDAISQANAGTTLLLRDGVYSAANLQLNKPITIKGSQKAVLDIQNEGYGFVITADSVSIEGISIKNTGLSYTKEYAAIYVTKSQHFTIKDVLLTNVTFGILVEKSKHGTISGTTISGEQTKEASAGNGIHLWDSSYVTINENEVFNMRDGIYFEFVTHSKVNSNNCHNNIRYGLHFMFSNNDQYHDNTFKENGAGVAVMFSKQIIISRNTFSHNWGTASYGLLLKEIYDAEITHNTIAENTIGINVEGSTRINYKDNDFISNGWALKVRGACYNNVFEDNNFMFNSFDVSYNSKLNDNAFVQNYWSNYSGYDLDKDGLGDVPFRPVKLFSYVVNETPETIVLLRSLFVDIIDFSEKVSPIFTPDDLVDPAPRIKPIVRD